MLIPTVAVLAVLVFAASVFDTTQIGVLALVVAAAAAVYLAAYLRFGAGETEQAFYRDLGAAMFARLVPGSRTRLRREPTDPEGPSRGAPTKRRVRQ
jgi:hypothetical protein